MFREHVSDKPVVAVIYTHTHIDHYGGVKGVVDPADVASGKVPIIAPGHDRLVRQVRDRRERGRRQRDVAAGARTRSAACSTSSPTGSSSPAASASATARSRRSPTSPRPTAITETGTKRDLAGLTFEFLYAPDTEAPEEMHIWIPQLKALTCAENANHCAAQHPDPARRPHPRRPQLRPLPRRDARTLGRRGRGALRPAHLAGVGQRRTSSRSSSRSATRTSTSTTRRCGWPTRATPRSRRPR